MKIFQRLFIWIIISLMIQGILYFYLDRFYFADEKQVKITKIDDPGKKENMHANVNIPDNTRNIALSYDAHYTTYYDEDDILNLIKTDNGESQNITFASNAKCIAYKWLPDANIMILAEMLTSKNTKTIKFYSYDADTQSKKDIEDASNPKASMITIKDGNSKVEIEVSTLTGVMYAKVTGNNTNPTMLYRIDRNEDMTKVRLAANKIGTFKVASHDDLIAYEDLTAKDIKTTAKSKTLKIQGNTRFSLIDADGNNNIYVADEENGKISKLYYGKLSDDSSTWTEIPLEEATAIENIHITEDGEVYINSGQGALMKVNSDKKLSFDGQFIGVYGNYIASVKQHKLLLNNIK